VKPPILSIAFVFLLALVTMDWIASLFGFSAAWAFADFWVPFERGLRAGPDRWTEDQIKNLYWWIDMWVFSVIVGGWIGVIWGCILAARSAKISSNPPQARPL